MEIGRVTSAEVGQNRDNDTKSLLLEIQISDADDIQTGELFSQSGEDYNPPKDSRVVTLSLGNAFKVAIAVNDGTEPTTGEGERELYSVENGERKAKIRLQTDGVVMINDGSDFAVRFSELKAAYDELRDFVNDFITNTYNTHTQPISGGAAGVPAVPGIPTTATIDAAKVDSIKVP